MRNSNPALSDKVFSRTGSLEVMTLPGTVNKCLILIAIVIAVAFATWSHLYSTDALGKVVGVPMWYYAGIVLALITSLVIIFKPTLAPLLSPFYAVLEGLTLGLLSLYFESRYPGVVVMALLGTLCVFVALLLIYRLKLIKPTENFKLGVVAATGGIFFIYLASLVMNFFGHTMPYLHESSPMGIAISVIFVIVASLNLVLDFDFIERGVDRGAPKYMEWYAAFGLLITLVWIYIELLRLFAKLNDD